MKLSSPAFVHQGLIPALYTCEGKGINPPLKIQDVPAEAASLVLFIEDPDVPSFVRKDRMWDHWILFNLPPTTEEISEGSVPLCLIGRSTGGSVQYEGPCPPDREHRYFFKLYALDILLPLLEGATKKEVEAAMEGHLLAATVLMGRYGLLRTL